VLGGGGGGEGGWRRRERVYTSGQMNAAYSVALEPRNRGKTWLIIKSEHVKPNIKHHLLLPIDLDKWFVTSLKKLSSRLRHSKQPQTLADDLEHVRVDAVAVNDFCSERAAIKKISEENKREARRHDCTTRLRGEEHPFIVSATMHATSLNLNSTNA
jgi:hypothetical protein